VAAPVPFSLDLTTPHGRLRATVPLPERPLRLSEVVPLALQIGGQVVAQTVRRAADEGRPVTCGPACGACCRQLAAISIPEAFAVMAALRHTAPDHRRRIEERFAGAAAVLQQHPGLLDRVHAPGADAAAANATARDYFALQLPCPFLEDESCSIHRDRPSICREVNVVSPPALCRDPFANAVQSIRSPVHLSEILARLHAHLYQQPAPLLVPLSLAPTWVTDHPDLDRLAWPADRLLPDLVAAMQRAMAA